MSGGFLAVQAKRSAAQRKKINLGRDSIQQGWTNVYVPCEYIEKQSVNPIY